jgi:hypothetical protein
MQRRVWNSPAKVCRAKHGVFAYESSRIVAFDAAMYDEVLEQLSAARCAGSARPRLRKRNIQPLSTPIPRARERTGGLAAIVGAGRGDDAVRPGRPLKLLSHFVEHDQVASESAVNQSDPGWQAMDWPEIEELCDRFFATDSAAPFTDSGHRELLLELLEDERDPLRWSAMRVEQAIGSAHHYDYDRIPLEIALDAPDLLRAFIPFAHAQSGIRDELTSRALAVIDALRSSYKREVLKEAEYWGYLDAG